MDFMNLETIPYVELIIAVFLLGYWLGIFILLYHLIRFGIGTLPKRIALILLLGAIALTALAILIVIRI